MGAVDNWLREHAVLHTTTAPTIQTRTVLSKKVLVLEKVVFDVSCIKQTHLCVCGFMQRNTQTKSATTANERYLDRTT